VSLPARCLGGVALVMLAATVARAAVTAQARLDPQRVAAGEQAELTVEVRGTQDADVPAVPASDGAVVQYVGPATQISIVNGQTSSSITHHFTVTARREGTITLGPITVTADGQTLQAGTVTLQVSAGAAEPRGQAEPLRLELDASRTRVYLHERLPITLTLLVGATQVGDVQFPQVPGDGFALEPLGQPTQRRGTRDGVSYQMVEFRSALTPLRTGTVTVGPATMNMSVLSEQRRGGHGFFFGGPTRQSITLESAPLMLDVLPLPEEGKPADFSGAVGEFALDVRAAPLEVTAGDPVTLTYTLHGEGELSSATPPTVPAGAGLRVYPVQAASAPAGSPPATRVFEQVVIPQQPGTVTLPAVRFSWFDPRTAAYRTAEGAPIRLAVRAAPAGGGPQIVGGPAGSTVRPEEPLGRDIVFIKEAPGALLPAGTARWRRWTFWAAQLAPLLALLGAIALERRRQRLGTDTRRARAARAGRDAREALGRARQALARGDTDVFHDALAGALADYLGAKLDLPPGAVSAEEIGPRLRAAHVPDALVDEVRQLLGAAEQARFAPVGARDGNLARTLDRAEALVRSLERSRTLARVATAASIVFALLASGVHAASVETPQAIFFRANALYADGRYGEAASEYERMLATGVASANTWFNLGNARLKAGQVGQAVLAYERAARLAPGDPDIRANLAFAREQAGVPAAAPGWTRLLFPLAHSWSTDALLGWAAVAWWVLALCLILRRLAPAVGRAAGWGAVAAALGLVVLGTSAGHRLVTVDLRRTAVVVAPAEVGVRFEPSSTGTVHFEAKPGTTLRLLGERDGWVQVGRDDGLRGWVERAAVGEV
jgi:tetratricopeptide (TPR) repeat protein